MSTPGGSLSQLAAAPNAVQTQSCAPPQQPPLLCYTPACCRPCCHAWLHCRCSEELRQQGWKPKVEYITAYEFCGQVSPQRLGKESGAQTQARSAASRRAWCPACSAGVCSPDCRRVLLTPGVTALHPVANLRPPPLPTTCAGGRGGGASGACGSATALPGHPACLREGA